MQKIVVIDFGSQFTQLISRRVRELNTYCEIYPYNHIPDFINDKNIIGLILSGSPFSTLDSESPQFDYKNYINKFPILAICYGAQYISKIEGGEVSKSSNSEYGGAFLKYINHSSLLFHNISLYSQVWMSHGDTINNIPKDFELLASTEDVENAAFKLKNCDVYGIQFHPEVTHSECGMQLLSNFVVAICHSNQEWSTTSFIEGEILRIQNKVGNDNVILGLSGGVDSSVVALLLHKAIGSQLYNIFVDNGLLRKNEYQSVLELYKKLGLNIIGVDAKQEFYEALKGITDPEEKRKIIGKKFIDVFDREAQRINNVKWLAQGTIYPDVIESISVNGPSSTIKSHHNVGGLPDKMNLKLIEPIRSLFKDEVREVGSILNLDYQILNRHPFPGPGLAIRIIGEITEEKIKILQEADDIFINHLKDYDFYHRIWQAGVILLNTKSVGVMGDERTYEHVVALRAVSSSDGMTADWVDIPYKLLRKISNTIINKVKGINRVTYDISSKPPATIEWE